MEKILFEILAGLTILSALMVISAKNPVHSVLYLILAFTNATGILILWKVDFLAMILLIVYVGAIAILFLFVVMMLNIKLVEITENQLRYLPIGGIIALIFLLELFIILESEIVSIPEEINKISYISWDESYTYMSNIKVIGQVLYTECSYLFLLSSIILLLGMIGAIVITEKKKLNDGGTKKQIIEEQLMRDFKVAIKLIDEEKVISKNNKVIY